MNYCKCVHKPSISHASKLLVDADTKLIEVACPAVIALRTKCSRIVHNCFWAWIVLQFMIFFCYNYTEFRREHPYELIADIQSKTLLRAKTTGTKVGDALLGAWFLKVADIEIVNTYL